MDQVVTQRQEDKIKSKKKNSHGKLFIKKKNLTLKNKKKQRHEKHKLPRWLHTANKGIIFDAWRVLKHLLNNHLTGPFSMFLNWTCEHPFPTSFSLFHIHRTVQLDFKIKVPVSK